MILHVYKTGFQLKRSRDATFVAPFQIVLAAVVAGTVAESAGDRVYYQYRGPAAPLSSDGTVMDTPEVAQAKAAHMAVHAEAMARLRKARTDYEMYENNDEMMPDVDPMEAAMKSRLRPDTPPPMQAPQMTEAKMETRARSASKASEFYELDVFNGRKNLIYLAPLRLAYKHTPYRGPFAPLGPDGRVVDTPEVMRAREAHMKAHARALALSRNELYY